MELRQKIVSFPLSSGVYLMKNLRGEILYVGKAVSLRKRVQSYFRSSRSFSKTDALVSQIDDIEIIETASAAEALILEASLIKKYKPKFNVELRDDKSYPVIEITNERFPKISIVRPRVKRAGCQYYGPYVNVKLVREALKIIRKFFISVPAILSLTKSALIITFGYATRLASKISIKKLTLEI